MIDNSYHFYKCITEHRTEDVFPFSKPMKNVKKERKFDHEHSVFKSWKLDNASSTESCLIHDFRYWKGARFCKDPDELKRVEEVIRKNFV